MTSFNWLIPDQNDELTAEQVVEITKAAAIELDDSTTTVPVHKAESEIEVLARKAADGTLSPEEEAAIERLTKIGILGTDEQE